MPFVPLFCLTALFEYEKKAEDWDFVTNIATAYILFT